MPTQSSSDGESIPDHRIVTVSPDLERVVGATDTVGLDWVGAQFEMMDSRKRNGKRRKESVDMVRVGDVWVVQLEVIMNEH